MMPFRDLPPDLFPKIYLQHTLNRGQTSHAYLFAGPGQEDALSLALALSQALVCPNPHPHPVDGCGTCLACRQVASGTHPDVHRIATKGRTLKVEDIRRLRDRLSRMSVAGEGQVAILEEAHKLSREGANALLKTLEEPPGPTTFLLLSSQPSQLPTTILSRVQTLFFPLDPQARKGLSPQDNLALLLKDSQGYPLDQEEDLLTRALAMRQDLFDLLVHMDKVGPDRIAVFSGPMRKDKSLIPLAVRLAKSFYVDGLALAYDSKGPFFHSESPDTFGRLPLMPDILEEILKACDQALLRLAANVDGEHSLFLLLTRISRLVQTGSK